jgi:hypothetical protein
VVRKIGQSVYNALHNTKPSWDGEQTLFWPLNSKSKGHSLSARPQASCDVQALNSQNEVLQIALIVEVL